MQPSEIVQAAIDAYHAHDLDRCLSFYAPDVVVKDGAGTVLMDGAAEVRARYAKSMAEHPNLRYDIPNRIALDDWVVDEERVTGRSDRSAGEVVRAVLVYRFEDGLIREIVVYT
jgi:hypothetical protein